MGSKPTNNLDSISSNELRNIKKHEIERFRDIDIGIIDHPFFFKPCKVKILMLVDDGISYNQFYFGLSEVLDTLRTNPEWWVKFEITRAHRSTDPNKPASGSAAEALYAPHYEHFAFDQSGFNLDNYDQVWFYGFNSSQDNTSSAVPPALKESELEILFRWMDNGGGVFATGDHYTLGASLCSKIPRVRNMRKWTVADGVPSNVGPNRHDTLMKGHDYSGTTSVNEATQYTFDDESDDIPMNLRLRWYKHHHFGWLHHHFDHWHWPYFWYRTPHPVMCGKDGPINILPDHPHEGEVVVPSDLTDDITHGTYTAPEYPYYNGSPLSPEIIAWARVQDDHGPSPISFKGSANAKEFGAVGAYNGHVVDVGRVIVDSTWHHWFDVNLTGRMFFNTDNPGNVETTDPRKLNGFNDTPAGVAALNKIRNYYRNVAIWLSPKAKQKCMALRALWNSLYRYPLYADLRADMPIWVIGHHASEVLGKYAGHCHVKGWWPIIFDRIPLDRIFDPDNIRIPVETLRMLDDFLIGGILKTMLVAKEEGKYRKKLPDDNTLFKIAEQGAQLAIKEMIEHISLSDKSNQNLQNILKRSLG